MCVQWLTPKLIERVLCWPRSKANFARGLLHWRAQIFGRHVRQLLCGGPGRARPPARGVIDCRGTGRVMSRNNYMQIARARRSRPFIRPPLLPNDDTCMYLRSCHRFEPKLGWSFMHRAAGDIGSAKFEAERCKIVSHSSQPL